MERKKRRKRPVKALKNDSTPPPDRTLAHPVDWQRVNKAPSDQELAFFGQHIMQGHDAKNVGHIMAEALGYTPYEWALKYKKHPQFKEAVTAMRSVRAEEIHEVFTSQEIIPALSKPATEDNHGLWKSLKTKQDILSKQKQEDSPTGFEDQSLQQAITVTNNVDMSKLAELAAIYTPKDDSLTVSTQSKIIREEILSEGKNTRNRRNTDNGNKEADSIP